MVPESVWIAAIAIISPIVVGVCKALLDSRKVKVDASVASFTAVEKRNEFLSAEVDKLRAELASVHEHWQSRFDSLQEKYYAEREKVIRLESRHELRKLIRDEAVKELPFNAENELDFMEPFQAAVDAVVFANDAGKIIGMNPKAKLMFGYISNTATGKSLEILMPERFRAAHRAGIARIQHGEPSRMTGKVMPLYGLHREGWEFAMELSVTPFEVSGQKYFAGVIRLVEHGAGSASREPHPPELKRISITQHDAPHS